MKTLSEKWGSLNFRTQLVASHGGLLLVSILLLGGLMTYAAERILIKRGYDLLEATNRLSVKRFRDFVNDVDRNEPDCDGDSRAEWQQLTRSPHFTKMTEAIMKRTGAGMEIMTAGAHAGHIHAWSACAEGKVAEMRPGWLSELFNDRTGLGESGETYLLDESGRLVTESRFLERPGPAPLPSNIPEHWQGLKADYRGIPVLASWTRVQHRGFTGYIASEIDEAEVRSPIRTLFLAVVAFSLVWLGITTLIVPWLARLLSRNVERARELEQVKNMALIEGQERERGRISLELHDDIGQKLTALGWKVSASSTEEKEKSALASEVREVAKQVRALSGDLSPMLVQEVGLQKALEQLVESARGAGRAQFHFQVTGASGMRLDRPRSTAIYRVAQEALANVIKHSGAATVNYHLRLGPEKVALVVEDDGVGFEPGRPTGLGLHNMRVRAEAFGGRFVVGAAQPHGTRIEMEIPVREEK